MATDVTNILKRIDTGDPQAAAELLPLVYTELRRLAAQKLAREQPGQTLNPTSLVHEAYLRLVASGGRQAAEVCQPADDEQRWDSRGHFFAAAAEAMRRILVERARAKAARKRGGQARRVAFDESMPVAEERPEELLALDEALADLEKHDASAAQLVKLRYFAGLKHQEAAKALGVTRRAADRLWALARAWLFARINKS